MQTKTIRSGAPFVAAGLGALIVALLLGLGAVSDYLIAIAAALLAFAAGRRLFPDRTVTVEAAPKSGSAEVDALIAEAREQLASIRSANDAIADPALSAQIDDIETTCRALLSRLEEQPDMLSSMRTFLRYTLPATQKLLGERAKLEGEVASGQAQAIAGRIGEAMGQVQSALHKQLDALAEYRFIDLESEMDVLADVLKGDGLLGGVQDELPDLGKAAAQDKEQKDEDDPFASLFAKGSQG